jgi:hypothetical protein
LPAKIETVEDLRCGLPETNHTFRSVFAEWVKPLPRTNGNDDPAALRASLRERLGWPGVLPNVKAEKTGREEKGPWTAEFWILEPESGIRLPAIRIGQKGAAGPITLVPGRDREGVARALRAGRSVVALDLRGAGETAGADGVARNWAWFAGRPLSGMWALVGSGHLRFCRKLGARLSRWMQNAYGWSALLAGAPPELIASSGFKFPGEPCDEYVPGVTKLWPTCRAPGARHPQLRACGPGRAV